MRTKGFTSRFVQAGLSAAAVAGMLPVDVRAQSAVQAGGYDWSASVTPVIQASSYAASASIGGLSTIPIFRSLIPSGIFNGMFAGWKSGSTVNVTFYMFDKAPTVTTCTDKVAFSMGAADIDKLAFAPVSIAPVASQGATFTVGENVQVRSIANKDAPAKTRNIYVCAVANATVTPASTVDFIYKITGIVQD